ncbi:fibronectin type III domain-containing protein, partial [Arthrospira platensis SPKY1]|nr:fibronectin type III domain-containing protein [Arthrospira platensis SPKY1]
AQNRSPVTIAGLENGTTYAVALRAVNGVGAGATSPVVSATPMTVPTSPTTLAATPGDGQISIAFTAGDDGGSAVTNHEYSLDNGATWQAFDPPVPTSPVTVSGLANAVNHAVTLRARNSVGVSPPS